MGRAGQTAAADADASSTPALKLQRSSVLDPDAKEFVPSSIAAASSSSLGPHLATPDKANVRPGRSLIFGGGGDFLAKYDGGAGAGGGGRHSAETVGGGGGGGGVGLRQRRAPAASAGPAGAFFADGSGVGGAGGGGSLGSRPGALGSGAAGGSGLAASSGAAAGAAAGAWDLRGAEKWHFQLNRQLVSARHSEKVLQVVESGIDDFNSVNLFTALHRLATLATSQRRPFLRRDNRFKALLSRLSGTLKHSDSGDLTPQDLSNAAWALTKLGILNALMFASLADHIVNTIGQFEPVNLSMTLWAFARSGFLDDKLFRSAVGEVQRKLSSFQPQQIANTTWAMAKSGFVDVDLFDSVASLTLEKLEEFQPMNYSMLVYSFSLAKVSDARLFEAVGRRCTVDALASTQGAAPHVVTNLAVAYSESGVFVSQVFDSVAEVAISTLGEFRPQQIATLAQAFAKAEVSHERLFRKIAREASRRAGEFRPRELQDLADAAEALGLPSRELAEAAAAAERAEDPSRASPASFAAGVWLLVLAAALFVFAMATWSRSAAREGGRSALLSLWGR